MNKVKVWSVLLSAIGLILVGVVNISAESSVGKPSFTIRKQEPQAVLYTIHRGSYDKTGMAIGKLFDLAGQKGIAPHGTAYYVYLNNPNQVSSEHWLTEIRIPVSKEALKLAGTLGEMTDVKALPATELAVAIKPEGKADPSPIYNSLNTWIIKQGYTVVDCPREMFLTNTMAGDYAQMKSAIMFPVEKICPDKN